MPLAIKNLTKSFGNKVIFENFNYTFSDKGIYVLVGNSGRGKTTLLRMIAGLDKDFKGEITKAKTAYAFQEYRLFPTLNALDNITKVLYEKPTEAETKEAKQFLTQMGFADIDLRLFPAELSGGMKQRVALCRAFLSKTEILLLDEPFKELDAKLRTVLREQMKKSAENRLIIMTAHSQEALGDLKKTIIDL